MKTTLAIIAVVAIAVGYNYVLAEHGPAIYRAIDKALPDEAPAKPRTAKPARHTAPAKSRAN